MEISFLKVPQKICIPLHSFTIFRSPLSACFSLSHKKIDRYYQMI